MFDMIRKKPSFFAFLFIPVMGFLFAGFFTIVGVIGWRLLKPAFSAPKQGAATSVQTASADTGKKKVSGKKSHRPEQPKTVEQPQTPKPPKPAEQPKQAETASKLPTDPRERFLLGLKQCQSRPQEKFPCAWQDTQAGVIKQFKMDQPGAPIVRRIFDMGGRLLNLTSFNTQQGYVLLYRDDKNVNWFFDRNGVLRQIARPSRADFSVQDYYFYTVAGQLNSCVCADKTQACCSAAPKLEQNRTRFCELFPLDQEFCSK